MLIRRNQPLFELKLPKLTPKNTNAASREVVTVADSPGIMPPIVLV